jgi:hypothetical protein
LGSVSPVSSVNNPGLPSSAGIGVKFGSSESSFAAAAAFDLAAPELGLGSAEDDGTGDDGGAGNVTATGELAAVVPASDAPLACPESAEATAVFAVASLGDDALAVVFAPALADPSAARGLLSSATAAATTKKTATSKIAARSGTFKVRLLSTATAPWHRADDSVPVFPRRRRDEKKHRTRMGAEKGSIERVLPEPVKLAGL